MNILINVYDLLDSLLLSDDSLAERCEFSRQLAGARRIRFIATADRPHGKCRGQHFPAFMLLEPRS